MSEGGVEDLRVLRPRGGGFHCSALSAVVSAVAKRLRCAHYFVAASSLVFFVAVLKTLPAWAIHEMLSCFANACECAHPELCLVLLVSLCSCNTASIRLNP